MTTKSWIIERMKSYFPGEDYAFMALDTAKDFEAFLSTGATGSLSDIDKLK